MLSRNRSVYFCLIFVISLFLLCTPALAAEGFSDVSEGHWAEKYIDKMSAMGVISGYGDGTFRPDNDVSQLEAVVMAVRCMNEDAAGNVDVPFSVPWGERDVARAMELGLLKSDDDFIARSEANRAWVTRLLVRMVGMDGEARRTGVLPNFTDSNKIPGWADGHVKVAQDNNLVSGYSDDTFRPSRAVARKEMATFLESALDYIENKPGNVYTGRVEGVSPRRVAVNAGDEDFVVDSDVPVYDEEGKISLEELERNDRVLLVAGDGGSPEYVEKLEGNAASEVVSGDVKKVYAELGTVVVEENSGKYRNLYLPEDSTTSVSGSDKEGLDALEQGDRVEVTLDSDGYISSISVQSRSLTKENEGIVYEVVPEDDLITIQSGNGKLSSYPLAGQVTVEMENIRFPTLDDLSPGDRVSLGLEDDVVEVVEVLEVSSRLSLTGSVVNVSPGEQVITFRTEEGLKVFEVDSGADIIIGGKYSDLDDIAAGDEIEVEIENGEITALEVEGSRGENRFTATIKAVDTRNDTVTLQDKNDDLNLYELRDSVRIYIDGDEADLRDMEKDKRVDVRLIEGKIAYMELDTSVRGKVEDIDEDGLLIVLESEGSYILDEDVDVNSEDSRNDLDEIEAGDYVELNVEDDEVTEIDLRSQFVFEVDRVRAIFDRIYAEDEDGDRVRLRMDGDVELVVPGISNPDLDDVKEDDMVRATYMGYDLEQVEVLHPGRGEVTSVSSYSDTVKVKYYEGKEETLDFTGRCRVIIGGNSYDNTGRLSSGDRVQVLENSRGGYDFKVMERITGVLAHPPDDDEVYLEESIMGWKDYDLAESVYVHDRSGSLSLSSLDKGDSVRIYMLNDKVYEILLR